jgi:N-acetylglucosamine malate deacetylase 1
MSVLVVVAHPDDETLGVGATITKLIIEGEQVHIGILGKSRVPARHTSIATRHLGVTTRLSERFPDQRFDAVPFLEIAHAVEEWVQLTQPHTVYTHHHGDLNLDHVITSRAVLTACRPVNDCPVRTIYAMEIPSSTEWGDGSFQPTTFVDVAATLDRKIEAMQMYETERRDWPHPRSPAALRALAMTRGAAAGLEVAEAFQLLRHVIR